MRSSSSAARSMAYIILFILFITSGLSMSALALGNRDLGLQICVGSVVISVIVLIVGGFVVASNRPTQ